MGWTEAYPSWLWPRKSKDVFIVFMSAYFFPHTMGSARQVKAALVATPGLQQCTGWGVRFLTWDWAAQSNRVISARHEIGVVKCSRILRNFDKGTSQTFDNCNVKKKINMSPWKAYADRQKKISISILAMRNFSFFFITPSFHLDNKPALWMLAKDALLLMSSRSSLNSHEGAGAANHRTGCLALSSMWEKRRARDYRRDPVRSHELGY